MSQDDRKELQNLLQKLQDIGKGDGQTARDIKQLLAADLALKKGNQALFNYIMGIPDYGGGGVSQ